MKLASYKDGSRDGQLVVVSRDLKWAHYATGAATRMQHLLDDWGFISPQLQEIYENLNHGRLRHAFSFDAAQCLAPLPRALAWARLDGDARPVFGAGNTLGVPVESLPWPASAQMVQARVGLAAITADIPLHAGPGQGIDGVRLLALSVDLQVLAADPTRADAEPRLTAWRPVFSPVAVTPEEIGTAWKNGHVHLAPQATINDGAASDADTSAASRRSFGDILSGLARYNPVGAGTIVGSFGINGAGGIAISAGERLCVDAQEDSGASIWGTISVSTTAAA